MEDRRIGRRYAQALFAIAREHDVVTSVEEDLGAIANLMANDAEFRMFFLAPYNSRAEKTAVAERLFSDRITALTMQLLRVMLEKGRERELDSVRSEFTRLRREFDGILHAVITTAWRLDDTQKDTVTNKLEVLTNKKIEAEFEVDPKVMGGVKVAYGSYVLDGTVLGGLNRLRDQLRHDVLRQA